MQIEWTREDLIAALAWQYELGVDEAIQEDAVDRFAYVATPPKPSAKVDQTPSPSFVTKPETDLIAEATSLAASANDIETLAQSLREFRGFEIKRGARNFVFSDGDPRSRVMIVGEAPGRDEDLAGRPFVGKTGQLLDNMFAAIGLSRTASDPEHGIYVTNALCWRPPGNRTPSPEEIALARPFVRRHIELAKPDVLVAMGNAACSVVFEKVGILRLRGSWVDDTGPPVMPMTHPSYLLRTPMAKREAWADLLQIQKKLKEHTV